MEAEIPSLGASESRPRQTVFKNEWILKYGVSPCGYDTEARVNKVLCLFCQYKGRDKRADMEKNPIKIIKNWKTMRSDLFSQHHKTQHSKTWTEYQQLSDEEKKKFFPDLPETFITPPGHTQSLEPTTNSLSFISKPTADICDVYLDKLNYPIHANLKSYGLLKKFEGYVQTVSCPKDNSYVRALLSKKQDPSKGHILVIDAGAELGYAMLGDKLAQKGMDNGWKGVIVNGCIRDSVEINMMKIGVKALGTIPRKTKKNGKGNPNVSLNMLGVTFNPGDYLVADEDGIVVGHPSIWFSDRHILSNI
eukprot:snap_masked-scaffold_20-processed-gene-0.26-mRNA-1 protein AED:0.58 eAED:0.58 QI:0/-1/0/1/-1/1/1/0/305